jgi:hypothetical protein
VPNEKPDDRELPAVAGTTQRRLPPGVEGVDGRAVLEQSLYDRIVVLARGLVQRRAPGRTAHNIDAGTGREEFNFTRHFTRRIGVTPKHFR